MCHTWRHRTRVSPAEGHSSSCWYENQLLKVDSFAPDSYLSIPRDLSKDRVQYVCYRDNRISEKKNLGFPTHLHSQPKPELVGVPTTVRCTRLHKRREQRGARVDTTFVTLHLFLCLLCILSFSVFNSFFLRLSACDSHTHLCSVDSLCCTHFNELLHQKHFFQSRIE